MKGRVVLALVSLSSLAAACSVRPGSMLIYQNQAITICSFGLGLILTIFAFLRDLRAARQTCLWLTLLHPVWTMATFCCDCGTTQTGAAILVSILSLSSFLWDSMRRRPPES